MPLYTFKCSKCENEFDELKSFNSVLEYETLDNSVNCPKCSNQGAFRVISKTVFGQDGTKEPWQYDYTHKVNPKFVRDSKGNRLKFNPNTMKVGRKGQG